MASKKANNIFYFIRGFNKTLKIYLPMFLLKCTEFYWNVDTKKRLNTVTNE